MNFNNYTIKSQEAVQQAQQLAQTYGHQQIENEQIRNHYELFIEHFRNLSKNLGCVDDASDIERIEKVFYYS